MTLRTDDLDSTADPDAVASKRPWLATGIPSRPIPPDAPRTRWADRPAPRARAALRAASAAEVLPPARPVRTGLYRGTLKRGIDLTLVALAAPFILPLIGLLALLVGWRGGRPFYCQDRVGRAGEPYRMWKLRTMVPDADARLEAHLRADPTARAEWNSKQKLLDDPRVTVLGRWLRKSSLDELPQLWNVVKGDMSLVGPRPMMVSQQRLYPGRDYYELRPGVTGLWQISDRNASTFADRAKFDTVYNRTLSAGLDLGILVSTIRVVLRGTGH